MRQRVPALPRQQGGFAAVLLRIDLNNVDGAGGALLRHSELEAL